MSTKTTAVKKNKRTDTEKKKKGRETKAASVAGDVSIKANDKLVQRRRNWSSAEAPAAGDFFRPESTRRLGKKKKIHRETVVACFYSGFRRRIIRIETSDGSMTTQSNFFFSLATKSEEPERKTSRNFANDAAAVKIGRKMKVTTTKSNCGYLVETFFFLKVR